MQTLSLNDNFTEFSRPPLTARIREHIENHPGRLVFGVFTMVATFLVGNALVLNLA